MKVENTKMGDQRTIVTTNGQPMLVGLVMRQASSAPSRVKASLVMPVTTEDGEGIVPLPFAVPTMGSGKPRGFTPEFRLEMN